LKISIGYTTFLIRYLAWKILSTAELDNKSIFIISGTREEHANHIKEKLRELFETKFPFLKLESKYTDYGLKKHGSKSSQPETKTLEDTLKRLTFGLMKVTIRNLGYKTNYFIQLVHMRRNQLVR